MDLSAIDPRLVDAAVDAEDIVWRNALSAPFSLHGVYYDEGFGAYRRMPKDIAATVNPMNCADSFRLKANFRVPPSPRISVHRLALR